MWHAVVARKVERALSVQGAHGPDAAAAWRAVAHRAEDLLTAAVMGRLAYLPDDLGLALLLGAATPCGDVARPAPEPVTRSTPWPTWSDEDGDRREPDWVFETATRVYVVEVKWGRDHTPAPRQLADQRRHAAQRYAPERVVQIALVQSGRVVPPEGHGCLVATWAALRAGVASARRARAEGPTGRILSDLLAVLDARGLDAVYLDSLPALRLSGAPLPPLREGPADAPLPPLPDVSLHPEARFTPWS